MQSQKQESLPYVVSCAAVLALIHHFSSSNLVHFLLEVCHHDVLVHRQHPRALGPETRRAKTPVVTEKEARRWAPSFQPTLEEPSS
jgi:hypothetical protein